MGILRIMFLILIGLLLFSLITYSCLSATSDCTFYSRRAWGRLMREYEDECEDECSLKKDDDMKDNE